MTAPSLSTSICGLFSVLSRGAAPADLIVCRRHAGNAEGANDLQVRVAEVSDRFIPAPILKVLEEDDSPWTVHVGVQPASGKGGQVLAAVGAWFSFTRVYENPQDPTRSTGKRWRWPDRAIDAALARAAAFLPPTIVIDGRSDLVVLWALDRPLRPMRNSSVVNKLFGHLARHVGASVPDSRVCVVDSEVPLPGALARDAPGADPQKVVCRHLDLTAIYPLDTIERALVTAPDVAATLTTPATVPASPSTPSASRRRPRQETATS